MEQIGDSTNWENERDNDLAWQKPLKWSRKSKPLSWSAISSFKYDKERWYKKYVLGLKEPVTPELEFGKAVGHKLETDPTFLPEVPRESHMEYKLHVTFGDIELIGFCDSYGVDNYTLREYKTGKNPWTQQKVDEHGQITMYLLMLYIQHNILPEQVKCSLHWMPTEEKGDFTIGFKEPIEIKHFETKRTTTQIVEFGVEINNIIKQMESYE